MSGLPDILQRGERARLFPVLADTSKEGRTLSILLSCIESIHELGQNLLSDLGIRVGTRTKIESYTEVVLSKGSNEKSLRPDGLIIVKSGSKCWTALVEAKVGKNELTSDQLENYLDIAKQNGIDALITISNQFAPLPTQHPVTISANNRKKAQIFHWSWMYILTEAKILIDNKDVADEDQMTILNEMVRFLSHDSTGVKSFDQMPSAWTDAVSAVQAGGSLGTNSPETKEVIGAWHQETRDLSLILSRQLGTNVALKTQRAHLRDPIARTKADAQILSSEKCLQSVLVVPDAASPIEVCADLQTKTISVSMKLKAPADKKSTAARINWVLRQLQKSDDKEVYIRLFWPGRAATTQYSLAQLRDDAKQADDKPNSAVTSLEIALIKNCGTRFGQRKNFIVDLEQAVPEFYEQIGQHLRAWQPPAPKLREEMADSKTVNTEAIHGQAEGGTLPE